ncbi:MAG: PadR family transcriptional regulator [Bacteroidota bacterium]
MKLLSRTEEVLLLAVCCLQDEAFGLSIREHVEAKTGKRFSTGGIYVPLDRLVRDGLLTTEEGQPTENRLGRRRRRYQITAQGLAVLRETQAMHRRIWAGLPAHIAAKLQLG